MPSITEYKDCDGCEKNRLMSSRKHNIKKYVKLRWQLKDEMQIPLPQSNNEFHSLVEEVGKIKPKVFLEIGSRDGGSLWMISQYCEPGAVVISLDLPGARWGRKDSDINKRKVLDDLLQKGFKTYSVELNSQSKESEEEIKKIVEEHGTIDFLFIDGDHTFTGVLTDWDLYNKYVSEGGIVAFHDITERKSQAKIKVFLLWRSLKTIFKTKEFINNTRSPGIGVLYK